MTISQLTKKLCHEYPEWHDFFGRYAKGEVIVPPKISYFSGTKFQKKVLEAVCRIPYGQTASYSDIARRIGQPKAIRAVASAVAQNEMLIVIPCHRVIHKDGSPGNYNAGADLKQKLLDFEKRHYRSF